MEYLFIGICLLLWIVAVVLWKYRWSKADKRKKLYMIFSFFLIFFFAFGFLYQAIFIFDTKAFIFEPELQLTETIEEELKDIEIEIENLKKQEKIFNSILKDLETSYTEYVISLKIIFGDENLTSTHPLLAGEHRDRLLQAKKKKIEKYEKDKKELINRREVSEKRYNESRNRLNELKREASKHIIDFLYFSAVTLTTLGFGDILPNTSLTRFFVMIQIFLVLFLVVVGVNVVRG